MSPSQFTYHAWRRISSRSIPEEGIEAAIEYGRYYRNQGRAVYRLDRRSIQKARQNGADSIRLRAYEGIHVVIGNQGEIVTVYRNKTGKRVPR